MLFTTLYCYYWLLVKHVHAESPHLAVSTFNLGGASVWPRSKTWVLVSALVVGVCCWVIFISNEEMENTRDFLSFFQVVSGFCLKEFFVTSKFDLLIFFLPKQNPFFSFFFLKLLTVYAIHFFFLSQSILYLTSMPPLFGNVIYLQRRYPAYSDKVIFK